METKNPLPTRAEMNNLSANIGQPHSSFSKISYGNLIRENANRILVHPNSSLHHQELKRLNDMKSDFVLLTGGNFRKPFFLLDKVWATARALAKYLKSDKQR